jgi:RND family efflux transporter MFP subunit
MTSPERNVKTEMTGRKGSLAARIVKTLLVLAFLAAAAFYGGAFLGGRSESKAAAPRRQQPQAPLVMLKTVERADLAVGREYIGRVEAIQSVSLKPRISGQIEEVHFKEGSMVKEGDPLFTIDDRSYRATLALRRAELSKAEANYDRALKYNKRLQSADARSVSASDRDMAESDVLQGRALVEQARAALQIAQIDLGYTKIAAPISGQVGKALFTKGNYVTPSSGALTTIVQIDPVRVSFALPDRDFLDQIKAFRSSESAVYDATLRLPNGDAYPEKGVRDFESNMMDEKTGTMMLNLRFNNAGGLLVPGAMVRVSAKPANSRIASVIPQETLLADEKGDFVYVVDDKNVAHQRRVKIGAQFGSTYEILSGLEPGEKIVWRGLQSVRPEAAVRPAEVTSGNGVKSPAERAQESDFDLKAIASGDSDGAAKEPAEGKK